MQSLNIFVFGLILGGSIRDSETVTRLGGQVMCGGAASFVLRVAGGGTARVLTWRNSHCMPYVINLRGCWDFFPQDRSTEIF